MFYDLGCFTAFLGYKAWGRGLYLFFIIMAKKCIICNHKEAEFCIKNSSEYYCSECASENFSDLSYLHKVEDSAKNLKKFLRDKKPPMYNSDDF